MTQKIENTILSNLIFNDEYTRKVIPFLKKEYFDSISQRTIFEEISKFVQTYKNLPTQKILTIELEKRKDLNEQTFKEIISIIDGFEETKVDKKWIIDTTEKWCKDRAIYLSLLESIKIADGKDEEKTRDAIPSILSEALSVCFDEHIGHDYISDSSNRHDYYSKKEDKIPWDLDLFNKITKGGIPKKTLNVALAGTGVGKSLFMCHVASSILLQGRNVLYITLEMAEERIAERIDANLLNVNIKDLVDIPKQIYENKINILSKKTQGKLIIKEYPTGSAHAGHFRSLLNELALKKKFFPDIIFIDYLNICSSSRYKGSLVNSYTYIKAIAEELRGLAVEFDVPVFSATQMTRSGFGSSDPDLTDTSESFGLPATADFMFALIATEELENLGQIMIKQLKNRYNDPTMHKRFVIGIDRSKMRLYNVDDGAQTKIQNPDKEEEYKFEEISKINDKFATFKI